jgi:DNA repair protein SbcD/Mre11
MRLLHTSDWHLGRSLETEPLVEHQRDFLIWLADLARERAVDAILVSGDVHDRAIPSVDAVRLLQEAMAQLVQVCPVVFISGNHDSPTRLGFGGVLLEQVRVHFRASVDDLDRPVELVGGDGLTTLVYGIPYLEPEVVRVALEADKSHEAVLTAAMNRVRSDLDARRTAAHEAGIAQPRAVVLSHAFVTGGLASDSERDVSVGGVADAPASVYQGVDYVALGHLHGPQEIALPDGPIVRYSGSPLAYSFSEQSHTKSVTLVELDADGGVRTELVPTMVPRRLAKLTGELDTLLADEAFAELEDCWVWADLTDARRPEDAMERVRTRFPHAIKLSWFARQDGQPLAPVDLRVDPATAQPVDVVLAFIEHVTSQPPTAEETVLAHDAVEHVRQLEVSQ